MDWILELNSTVNSIVWGPPMLFLLIGTGILLTIATRGVQFRKFLFGGRQVLGLDRPASGEGAVSGYKALATSLSATVGVGNIAGIPIAITAGGPGAIFWLFVAGLFGMATKFAEIAIALQFREKDPNGEMRGGAMYVLAKGFRMPWFGSVFAALCALAAFGIGNLIQGNSVAAAMQVSFGVPNWVTGLALVAATALVVLGGLHRIAEVASVLVPVMCGTYVLCALYVVLTNWSELPGVVALVLDSAFTGHAAVGGFAGAAVTSAIRSGIARGLLSNEAGLGSAPIVHAAAVTDHAIRQATYGIFGVFIDTIVVCMLTASTVLLTRAWTTDLEGLGIAAHAFQEGLPGAWGGTMVSVAVALFGFSTILGWAYYGETGFTYLFGVRGILLYRIAWSAMVYVGAIGGLQAVWDLTDTMNALMAIPNLFAVLGSVGLLRRLMREFFPPNG
ncbi:MAG: sodium:alanine symporter family protein [Bryobacterales bacterium]|nr:sodium:alanine symporter family protein [Bryobacterales bacterium]